MVLLSKCAAFRAGSNGHLPFWSIRRISNKMGENFVNFMGGSPLNRLSWLRPSQSFLNAIVASPATRWILFKSGMPLLATNPSTEKRTFALLTTRDVEPLLGPSPYFGQGQNPGQSSTEETPVLEAARLHGPRIVFLGLEERDPTTTSALPSLDFKEAEAAVANINGTPYFSVDVAALEEGKVDEVVQNSELAKSDAKLAFTDPRAAMGALDMFAAAVFANARSMVDWNDRNKACIHLLLPADHLGSHLRRSFAPLVVLHPTLSGQVGSFHAPLYCHGPTTRARRTAHQGWSEPNLCKQMLTELGRRGLHNFCHPRTDPVVIMLIMNEARDKVILGRNKRFPPKFYSALAGFVEPGESYEDAVRREMWEEAGVKVWNIRYHSGQPWVSCEAFVLSSDIISVLTTIFAFLPKPFPANLMLGFYATADASKPIRTDLDNELEDARWYTREEVLASLNAASGTTSDKIASAWTEDKPKAQSETDTIIKAEPLFKMPPTTAVAGVLIKHWAEGKVDAGNSVNGYL
ncbi:NUDIX hydrolase domain-like protein [Lanmaoa asiatica]|nr:NUDIX hydrolase domain-like protein [Lanmaoa asiatica]